jgi:hypothetical protein
MKGDLHYEVVLDASGREYRLYFSDATREDLPASLASSASLTIRRAGEAEEAIPLQIDAAGESWVGSGRVVRDPAKTTARVAFTVGNEPYWIDVGFLAPAASAQPALRRLDLHGLARDADHHGPILRIGCERDLVLG